MASGLNRRAWLRNSARAGAALALAGPELLALAQPQPRVIAIRAKKFEFTPDDIKLARGEAVVLEITASDVTMGFKCIDLGIRVDLPPGMPVRLSIAPERAGQFTFFCDVFCGDDHELMTGTLSVD